jgi:hypothetical protein
MHERSALTRLLSRRTLIFCFEMPLLEIIVQAPEISVKIVQTFVSDAVFKVGVVDVGNPKPHRFSKNVLVDETPVAVVGIRRFVHWKLEKLKVLAASCPNLQHGRVVLVFNCADKAVIETYPHTENPLLPKGYIDQDHHKTSLSMNRLAS